MLYLILGFDIFFIEEHAMKLNSICVFFLNSF